jgi:hypothetical protein
MELNSFDAHCLEMLEAIPKRHSKQCFRSAINHLKLAEYVYPHDKSMGIFRYITAEEEAASGLIRCLKEVGYDNADKLNPRKHPHKHSVIPFFRIMCQFIEDSFRQFGITNDLEVFEEGGKKKLRLVTQMLMNEQPITFVPEPPLNFAFEHQGKRFSYKSQMEKLISSKGAATIIKHNEEAANLRNLLLYASPEGCPSPVQVEEKFFAAYQSRVFAMLRAYLMIVPYKEKMPFVQDSLDAALNMMGLVKFDDIHDDV